MSLHQTKIRLFLACFFLEFRIFKCLALSSVYLIGTKKGILSLFDYNFRPICLYSDEKHVQKLSFLTYVKLLINGHSKKWTPLINGQILIPGIKNHRSRSYG